MGKAKGRHVVEGLSAVTCRTAAPGRHSDGRGLYLIVEPGGARRWMQRIVIGGKRRDLGLGGFPAVTLSEARDKALANKRAIEAGRDPLAEKKESAEAAKAIEAVPTFAEVVTEFLKIRLVEFRNDKHKDQWRNTLASYAGPVIGLKPIDQITTDDILKILRPIWIEKTETASRLRGRLERVLQFAVTKGYRTGENPARWRYHMENLLAKPGKIAVVENQPALALADASAWFAKLRDRDGVGARALEFAALTAARSGEVRGAVWSEFDLVRGIWTVPASRMKGAREHRVPLSGAALALIQAQPRMAGTDLVFPGSTGKKVSDMTLSAVMRRMHVDKLAEDQEQAAADGKTLGPTEGGWRDPRNRRPIVPHGLRSTFRQWAAERGVPRDLAEMALAHFIGSEVERSYQRSDMLERRRAMMEAWSEFLAGREASNVVALAASA